MIASVSSHVLVPSFCLVLIRLYDVSIVLRIGHVDVSLLSAIIHRHAAHF